MSTSTPYCSPRAIAGVASRIKLDYYGVPMRGSYFVENTLEGRSLAAPPTDPVILVAGTFDPHRGEYRADLIHSLLHEHGISTVLELHYAYEGKAGRIEPGPVVEDFRDICLDQRIAPRIVALCGGCLTLMEALLVAAEAPARSRVRGVLFVSSFLPDFMSLTGNIVAGITMRQETHPGSKIHTYAGHGEVLENGRRLFAWYRDSKLRRLVYDKKHTHPFPIPVRTVYFRLDMLSGRGRRHINRIFTPTPMRFLRGLHNTLRRVPEGDRRVVDFCRDAPETFIADSMPMPFVADSAR